MLCDYWKNKYRKRYLNYTDNIIRSIKSPDRYHSIGAFNCIKNYFILISLYIHNKKDILCRLYLLAELPYRISRMGF